MKRFKYILYFLIYFMAGLSLSSCFVAQPVLRLSPAEPNTRWLMGKEFSTKSTNSGIITAIAFESLDNRYFILDVEIANFSNDTLLIDPSEFSYSFLSDTSQFYKVKPTASNAKIFALNPEKMLLDIDKAQSRQVANRKNATAFAITAAVAVVATAAVVSSKNKNKRTNNHSASVERNNNVQRHNSFINNACPLIYIEGNDRTQSQNLPESFQEGFSSANLALQKESWAFETLRKTHLFPDDRLRGKLVFPTSKRDGYIVILAPFKSEYVKFLFRQKLHVATTSR